MEYTYVSACWRRGTSRTKVNQIPPSTNCCTPNSRGIMARGSSLLLRVARNVATPRTESDPPAAKLAVAEKHMRDWVEREGTSDRRNLQVGNERTLNDA